jgi:hypothetical protein
MRAAENLGRFIPGQELSSCIDHWDVLVPGSSYGRSMNQWATILYSSTLQLPSITEALRPSLETTSLNLEQSSGRVGSEHGFALLLEAASCLRTVAQMNSRSQVPIVSRLSSLDDCCENLPTT